MQINDLKNSLNKDKEFIRQRKSVDLQRDVASMIKDTRILLDYSQKEFGEKVGIEQANISRIESGQHYPNLRTLEKIAEALETHLEIKFGKFCEAVTKDV